MTSLWSTKKKDLIYLKAVELSQGANKVPDEVCGCVTAGGGSPQYPFSILPLTSPLHVKQNRILLRDSYSIDICRKAASKHLVSSKHYLSGIFCWASWKEMFLLLFLRYNPDYVFYRVMDTSHKLGPVLASFCSILLQFIPLISRTIPVVSAKIPSRPVRDPSSETRMENTQTRRPLSCPKTQHFWRVQMFTVMYILQQKVSHPDPWCQLRACI